MIRWCSFCQSYIGEAPPFDDYQLTHGICTSCRASLQTSAPPSPKSIQPIQAFYNDLWTRAHKGETLNASSIHARATALGIAPADLLIGAIQPLLYRIGQAWQDQELTEREEKKFSLMVSDLLDILTKEELDRSSSGARTSPPDILLGGTSGNHHLFGPQFMLLALSKRGVSCSLVAAHGSGDSAWTEAIAKDKPRLLGISVSMHDQLFDVTSLIRTLLAAHPLYTGRIVLGGLGSQGVSLPPELASQVRLHDGDIDRLVEWIRR